MVLFICLDIYSMSCFPTGSFGLSGFSGFGGLVPPLMGFSPNKILEIVEGMRNLQRNWNCTSQTLRIYKSSFPNSKHAVWNSKPTSAGASSDFQAENSRILPSCAFPWILEMLNFEFSSISQRIYGSEQWKWRAEVAQDSPCNQTLLADDSFILGLIWVLLKEDLGGKRAPWKQGMTARKQMKGAAWSGTDASEMLCIIAAGAELCL